MASALSDVLVVGGGPAGLSVATTLVRQLHTVLLFDSGQYRNSVSDYMHNVPTWDHRSPAKFRAAAKEDLEARYASLVNIIDREIVTVSNQESGTFEARDSADQIWKARKVVLACGVVDEYPNLDGYAECWGKAIFHCLFCHGFEERAKPSCGVLAVGTCATKGPIAALGRNASRLAKSVTIYANGSSEAAAEARSVFGSNPQFRIDSRDIKRLSKQSQGAEVKLEFEDGSEKIEAFLAHAPQTSVRSSLAKQLELKLSPNGDLVATPPFHETSVKGVFAAGDCMSPYKIVSTALASGAMVAGGISHQLQAEDHSSLSIL